MNPGVVEDIAPSGDFGLSRNKLSVTGTATAISDGTSDEPNDPSSDLDSEEEEMLASYEDESLTEMILDRLESIIDRLYRLSFRIRNPATRLDISKASRYRQVDESTNIDLMDMFAEADRRHICELLKGSPIDQSKDNYLVSRLSQANNLRRKQFRHWGRHRRMLKGSSQSKHIDKPERLPKLVDGSITPRSSLSLSNKEPSRPATATRIADKHIGLDDGKSAVSASTYVQLYDADATAVSMPPPPNIPSHRKEFECPYCYILCSRRTLEKKIWEYVS